MAIVAVRTDWPGEMWAVCKDARKRKLKLALPAREVYVKGPDLIFKVNPKNYLTEIQLPFKN